MSRTARQSIQDLFQMEIRSHRKTYMTRVEGENTRLRHYASPTASQNTLLFTRQRKCWDTRSDCCYTTSSSGMCPFLNDSWHHSATPKILSKNFAPFYPRIWPFNYPPCHHRNKSRFPLGFLFLFRWFYWEFQVDFSHDRWINFL